MIYDRTQRDVDTALSIRARLQSGDVLTELDIEALERGTLTVNTLNRIEQKQNELKGVFNSLGYWNANIENRVWDYGGIFNEADFDRILSNLKILKDAYYVFATTPSVPSSNYRQFATINAVEHILSDLEKMKEDMEKHYRICGITECGGI